MSAAIASPTARPPRLRSRLERLALKAAPVLVATAAGAAMASAASTPGTLRSSRNAALGKVLVVDGRGQTVYALRPETSHHLLCTSHACLQIWPPVTVGSRARLKAGPGVAGHLGILRRSDGALQVTLGGLPLYRFAFDRGVRGHANGQGIMSFGGTWHVITAHSSTGAAPKPAAPAAPAPAAPGY